MKHDPAQIIYKQLGKDENLKLVMYASASHGNLPDGGSQLGYLIFLARENIKCSVFNCPKELNELLGVLWLLSELISEVVFDGVKHIPIEIYTDSKSLNMMLYLL